MTKFSEEGMFIAKTGWKRDLLCQMVSQVVNVKDKFLKEIKSSTLENMQMVKKWNSLFAGMYKALVLWVDPAKHNLPKFRTRHKFSSILWRQGGEEALEEKFEAKQGLLPEV